MGAGTGEEQDFQGIFVAEQAEKGSVFFHTGHDGIEAFLRLWHEGNIAGVQGGQGISNPRVAADPAAGAVNFAFRTGAKFSILCAGDTG